jgi:methylthioribulose-1-phosphate dehydratase
MLCALSDPMSETLSRLRTELIAAGQFFHSRGWVPATSSNFSARLDAAEILITSSGQHKGLLDVGGFLRADLHGVSLEAGKRPSAETSLHTVMYRRDPAIGSVLHTHSVNATVLSMRLEQVVFDGYEVQKAFPGVETHESRVVIPVFPNSQDIPALAAVVNAYLDANPQTIGYLIRGHGLYTWGATVADTVRHIEALEFLFECVYRQMLLDR